ncbi:hypothetical protein CFI09_25825 (plasmid) [Escherichia coli]|nr:hypothetical protein CFI09_25825 [Escherichia coli]
MRKQRTLRSCKPETANLKQQTCNIVLPQLLNPLRCFAAGKVFISETSVNKYRKVFACSG